MSAPAAILAILAAALLFWLAWRFEWLLELGEREFNEAYRSRRPLSDDTMVELYFKDSKVDPIMATEVRRIFGHQLQYDALRLFPDDDFTFVFVELDAVELVNELEEFFKVELPDADTSQTKATIRAMSELVQRKLNEKAKRVGGFD